MCNINYHVVWCVKYRRKIITPQIEQFLKELAQEIARDKGFTVHLFEAGEMELRQKLWKGQLWNHSYYVETVGSVSEDAIRKYIENQSKSY